MIVSIVVDLICVLAGGVRSREVLIPFHLESRLSIRHISGQMTSSLVSFCSSSLLHLTHVTGRWFVLGAIISDVVNLLCVLAVGVSL